MPCRCCGENVPTMNYPCYGNLCRDCFDEVFPDWGETQMCLSCRIEHCLFNRNANLGKAICLLCHSKDAQYYPCYGNVCDDCWERRIPRMRIMDACLACLAEHCLFHGRNSKEPLDSRDEDDTDW